MRHSIIYLAAGLLSAAAMLTSCDYRLDEDNSGGIRFTAEAVSFAQPGVRTKATPVNTVSAFTDTYTSFKVSAYKGTTARVSNGTVSYSSSAWSLNQTAKWYSGETLDFYALAFPETTPPMITLAENMSVIPSTKTAIFDYSFSLDSATGENTPDIMFGYYSGTGTLSGNKRVAPLTFYHPFAAIKFKAGADLVGATVNSITIKNVANGGTCTIAASNLATVGNSAISWTHDSGHIDYSNTYTAAITAANQQIGTDSQTFMIIPQTMGETAKLVVNLTVEVDGVNKTVTLEASLNNLTFTAGTIHTFTVNFSDIPLDFTEPNAAIVAYVPDEGTHINDPTLVPTYAYMPTGQAFNDAITGLVNGRSFTKIVFNRFGSVGDTTPDTVEIQEAGHEEAEKIYAHYDNGEVIINTKANTIYLNADCSHMFEDMNTITEIHWGNFFESNEVTDTRKMFMGCSALTEINLSNVLNPDDVLEVSHMFDGCIAAEQIHLGTRFTTTNVTDISYMFNNCHAVKTISLGLNFSTEKVATMDHMCCMCYNLVSYGLPRIYTSCMNLDYCLYGCNLLTCSFPPSSYPNENASAYRMLENAVRPSSQGGRITSISHAFYNWLVAQGNTGLDTSINVEYGTSE